MKQSITHGHTKISLFKKEKGNNKRGAKRGARRVSQSGQPATRGASEGAEILKPPLPLEFAFNGDPCKTNCRKKNLKR